MSLNGIAASAVTALQSNTTALGVVANNVSNINTPGYARRVVNFQTLSAAGKLMGVDIASVNRVANQFLSQEMLSAGGSAAQYDTMAQLFTQLNGLLGEPGDNQSLATGLTNLTSAFAVASQAPSASASRTSVLNALNNLASTISNVSGTISQMQAQIDNQAASAITSTNALIKQIYDLNVQIRGAAAMGDQASGLLDQRDVALASLSQIIGVKTSEQPDGSINVSTRDGINLVSNTYGKLSYAGGGANGSFGNISIQDISPQTGAAIGNALPLDPHLSGGTLKGLIDMRDQVLGGLGESLGALAQQTALAFNAQANANAAYPPPTALAGRQTGLLATDALGFTGNTTIAVTSRNGTLVSRIDVDFDAGTIAVDGTPVGGVGGDIGSFASALNSALGSHGSASFANGQLSISATGGDGILVQDDAAAPSSRGGFGFSHFFGLNDLFQSQSPSILSTGLSASDDAGVQTGGNITLALKGPDGDIARQVSITTSAGQTIGDIVTSLNTALGGAAIFTLDANGAISTTNAALYQGYQLNVTNDTTSRGTTGVSISKLFGLGTTTGAAQAQGFSVTKPVAANPALIGLGSPALTSASVAGATIISAGSNAGAIALQNTISQSRSFAAAGGIAAQVSSLSDYAAGFYQTVSTLSNTVTANQTTQDDRLAEAKARIASNSGVSLDEELTNLSAYQQAYAAGARILSMVDELYKTLLNI